MTAKKPFFYREKFSTEMFYFEFSKTLVLLAFLQFEMLMALSPFCCGKAVIRLNSKFWEKKSARVDFSLQRCLRLSEEFVIAFN